MTESAPSSPPAGDRLAEVAMSGRRLAAPRPYHCVATGVPELRLVARLHVDLLRVASACCRHAR